MTNVPASIAAFLAGDPIAVAGVSRAGNTPANAIFRRLRDSGHQVIPLNPNASEIEGLPCFPDLGSVPGSVHGVMVVTHPSVSAGVARAAISGGVKHIWFHRSFGTGSVSPEALQECRAHGAEPIVGGCPLTYCQPVDFAHRCFRWWLRLQHRVPGVGPTAAARWPAVHNDVMRFWANGGIVDEWVSQTAKFCLRIHGFQS